MAIQIGVISDTHLKRPDKHFLKTVQECFKDVDMIIHAGDFTSLEVYEALRFKELLAVKGNRDNGALGSLLKDKEYLKIGDLRIGITHGSGSPLGIIKRVAHILGPTDIAIFGHSHIPVSKKVGDCLFLNPGSFRPGPLNLFRSTIAYLTLDPYPKVRLVSIS